MGGGESGDSEPPDRPRRRRRSSSVPLPASSGRITTELVGPPLRLPDESVDSLSIDLSEAEDDRESDTDILLGPSPEDAAGGRISMDLGSDTKETSEGALGLVARSRSTSSGLDLVAEMRERFDLDDYTGAMRAAELVLGRNPNHQEAQEITEASRVRLEQHYLTRLGTLQSLPRVVVKPAEVRWLGLDHRAGFLLSQIDGVVTVDELLVVSGMPRLETLKTLVDLLHSEAIRID